MESPMSLLRWLGIAGDRSDSDLAHPTGVVRRIGAALDQLEPRQARLLAAFAYLMARVARVDSGVSAEENDRMERLLRERGALPPAQASLVVEMARHESQLFGGTDNLLVSRELDELATREEKLRLLDCMFAVAAADESVSLVEDNEIWRIAKELKLSHRDFIEVRRRYREHLDVLKNLPG